MTPEEERDFRLMEVEVKNWRTCFNVNVIVRLLERIDELKKS